MSKQCRFCGGKITSDAYECEHCGKTLRKRTDDEKTGIANIESWKKKSVPSWVMYLVVGFFLFCFVLLFVQQTDRPANQNGDSKNGDSTSQTDGNPRPNPAQ